MPKIPFIFTCLFSGSHNIYDNYQNALDTRPTDWQWNDKFDGSEEKETLIGIRFRNLFEFQSYNEDVTTEIFYFMGSSFENIYDFATKIDSKQIQVLE